MKKMMFAVVMVFLAMVVVGFGCGVEDNGDDKGANQQTAGEVRGPITAKFNFDQTKRTIDRVFVNNRTDYSPILASVVQPDNEVGRLYNPVSGELRQIHKYDYIDVSFRDVSDIWASDMPEGWEQWIWSAEIRDENGAVLLSFSSSDTLVETNESGSEVFRLYYQVNDDGTLVTTDKRPPEANINRSVYVQTSNVISLDASASVGAEGETLTYEWSVINTPDASTIALEEFATDAVATLTVDVEGMYTVEVKADNGFYEDSMRYTFAYAVDAGKVPTIDSGVDQTIRLGESVQLNATLTGSEGSTVTCSLTKRPWGSEAVEISDIHSLTPTVSEFPVPGEYEVQFVAYNGQFYSLASSVKITVGEVLEDSREMYFTFEFPDGNPNVLWLTVLGQNDYQSGDRIEGAENNQVLRSKPLFVTSGNSVIILNGCFPIIDGYEYLAAGQGKVTEHNFTARVYDAQTNELLLTLSHTQFAWMCQDCNGGDLKANVSLDMETGALVYEETTADDFDEIVPPDVPTMAVKIRVISTLLDDDITAYWVSLGSDGEFRDDVTAKRFTTKEFKLLDGANTLIFNFGIYGGTFWLAGPNGKVQNWNFKVEVLDSQTEEVLATREFKDLFGFTWVSNGHDGGNLKGKILTDVDAGTVSFQ